MSSDEEVCYEVEIERIQIDYIDKVFSYIRGERINITTAKEFVTVVERIYRICEEDQNNLKLHNYYLLILTKFIQQECLPYLNSQKEQGALIKAFVKKWDQYTMFSKLMERVFDYLNRYYLKSQKDGKQLLGATSLQIFVEQLYQNIKVPLLTEILQAFTQHRNGEIADMQLLERVIKCYQQMGLKNAAPTKTDQGFSWEGNRNLTFYEQEFECHFITKAQQEYDSKVQNKIGSSSAPQYLEWADKCFRNEENYCEQLLAAETKPKLMKRVELELISNRNPQIVQKDSGVQFMLDNRRLDDLLMLYKCFRREDTNLNVVIKYLCNYIEKHGSTIMTDEKLAKDPLEFTKQLLQFKREIDTLISYSFLNNIKFEKARDNSFQNFMNENSYTAIYIANYCDNELRVGVQGLTNEEVDQRLTEIIKLFCCLHGRDLFIKTYQQFLCQRLLNKTVISTEAEELMLSKLKLELGINSVYKMTQMFKDIQLSKEMLVEFTANPNNLIKGFELQSVQVLTSGNWPIDEIPTCNIPSAYLNLTQKFERFYSNKFVNRKLMWLNQYGVVEMTTTFTQRKGYQLILNVFQATVLELYNQNDCWTYQQIQEKTNIPKKRLDAGLLMLCNPKLGLLQKQDNQPKFDRADEQIKLNLLWKSNNILVKLVPAGAAKKKDGSDANAEQKIHEETDKDRQGIIDGTLVKIMKTNKDRPVKQAELIEKAAEMITLFKPQPMQTKHRIEWLLQRGYFKRDQKDKGSFWYVA